MTFNQIPIEPKSVKRSENYCQIVNYDKLNNEEVSFLRADNQNKVTILAMSPVCDITADALLLQNTSCNITDWGVVTKATVLEVTSYKRERKSDFPSVVDKKKKSSMMTSDNTIFQKIMLTFYGTINWVLIASTPSPPPKKEREKTNKTDLVMLWTANFTQSDRIVMFHCPCGPYLVFMVWRMLNYEQESTKDIATNVNVTICHKKRNASSWQTIYKPFRNSFIGDTSL